MYLCSGLFLWIWDSAADDWQLQPPPWDQSGQRLASLPSQDPSYSFTLLDLFWGLQGLLATCIRLLFSSYQAGAPCCYLQQLQLSLRLLASSPTSRRSETKEISEIKTL